MKTFVDSAPSQNCLDESIIVLGIASVETRGSAGPGEPTGPGLPMIPGISEE